MTLYKKIATGIAGAAVIAAFLAPATFAAELEIVNNGADSYNKIEVTTSNVTEVKQSNSTNVTNVITTVSNTGGNTANKNTGGDVTVDTGEANTTVKTTVTGNTNAATVNNCCDCDGGTTASIRRNGADSTNKVTVTKANVSTNKQKNKTNVTNVITAKSKTGKNKANKNTGGTVEVTTGDATTDVRTRVEGGTNLLTQTGCCEVAVAE
jgi:hypothetical protein